MSQAQPRTRPGSYFLGVQGNPTGPYTVEQLGEMLRAGPATGDQPVWAEGMPGWASLASVPELGQVAALSSSAMSRQSVVPPPLSPGVFSPPGSRSEILGYALLATPVACGALGVANPPAAGSLMFLMILLTAALSAVEASRLGMGKPGDPHMTGIFGMRPVGWFFSHLLLWIVAYPSYLFRRSRYGVRSLGWAGVGAMTLHFVLVASAM